MTRINCIPVTELADQHLLIEYREITRVSKLSRVLADREKVDTYRLGTGHVKFFYDKGRYLHNRCEDLYNECIRRGFEPEYKAYYISTNPDLNKDWKPTKEDQAVNRTRLQEKIVMRPGFYRFNRIPIENEGSFYNGT